MSQSSALGARAWASLASCVLALSGGGASAQVDSTPSEGVADRPSRHVLLVNARVVIDADTVMDDGSIEIRDGRIVAVGGGRREARGAEIRDLAGRTVYPGFVEIATSVGVPADLRSGAIKPLPPGPPAHRTSADQPGTPHWNRRVRPERSVADQLDYNVEEARALRALGFTAAHAVPAAGVFRGQGAVISLRDGAREQEVLLAADRTQHIAFELAGGFSGEYPGSLMGAVALIRQTLLDARWHSQGGDARKEPNAALAALAAAGARRQRVHIQLEDELDVLRASRLASEFGLEATLIGVGTEYRVLETLRASSLPIVLPVAFPEAPQVEEPDTVLNTTLAELQHWEQAPANPARVAAAGVKFALTSRGLADPAKTFWSGVRRAVRAGLPETEALRALTTTPAALLGEQARLGRVAAGQFANLVVADAGLFRDDESVIHETWVEGGRVVHRAHAMDEASGTWSLRWEGGAGPGQLAIEGSGETRDATVGDTRFKVKLSEDRLIALPPATLFGEREGQASLVARINGASMEGYRQLADGRRLRFVGARSAAATPKADSDRAVEEPIPPFLGYPAGEYARRALPAQLDLLLFCGATVWTNTEDGVLADADVLVRRGRIAAVGQDLNAPAGAIVVDAAGRHLTPGVIDAHSHTAVARNVNEPSHAVTTEVRVADALDPTDIDLYRQLAGGVTTANLLHGSANPMGGQNAVIKLRWGAQADALLFAGAKPGVKFALGENVKQSGWGDAFVTRYPQTRLGVEQVMREHFNAAREYAAARRGEDDDSRRDLRLEALAEILAGERWVHVHSYRQDEILMFARLARDYDLRVAAFQHVLEGYKVADEIAALDAGASTFADWWGYKMEVVDGIPHNGALMTRVGVLTSFNSDSNEMARRLNMEAAKAVRHGGLDEQEALKLVTWNAAVQLGIEDRVGAIRAGMDADLVLWSDHPLSNFARAEQTWIDGRRYFDRDEDRTMQATDLRERERLLLAASKARSKLLELEIAPKQDTAEEGKATDPDAAEPGSGRWWVEQGITRGLYHNGADLMSCGRHDHVH